MTLIGAISKEGIVAIKIINESMKGDDFRQFIKNDLLPQLRKGAVVVMDNLRVHKMEGLEEMITSRGARVEYLPPYSPDMNPFAMMWSAIKSFTRLFPCRSREEMKKLIEVGLSLVEKSAFVNWMTKCCYCAS